MSREAFELSKDDPLVQQFEAGLEAWEQPFAEPEVSADEAAKVRARGAVRTRGKHQPHGSGQLPAFALPEDDPLVEQYEAGLEEWERPFESARTAGEDG
jgi:hypothetical protein